jgi:adenine-specific DNA-methyltransferase
MENRIKPYLNDVREEKIEMLKSIFPNIIKDGKIDVNALRLEIGEDIEVNNDNYNFTWSGKDESRKKAQEYIYNRTLKYNEKKSKNPDTTKNLYIEGDNLEILKILRQNYYNSIQFIYIDPPYNTGSDFIYNDTFEMETEISDIQEGFKGESGEKYIINLKSQNRYHATWLNMMYPRLVIAKDLLKDTGVIALSIDDSEVFNLAKICNEIFGEDNFMACFPRVTKKAGKSTDTIAKNNDYVLLYSKSNTPLVNLPKHMDEGFKFKDEYFDERGYYKLNQTLDYDSLQYSTSLDYPITIEGETIYPGQSYEKYLERQKGKHARADWAWRWSKELFQFGLEHGFVVVKKYETYSRIYTKTYQNATIEKSNGKFEIEYKERTRPISSLEFVENEFSNDNSKKNLLSIFETSVFDYSKPLSLLEKLIVYFSGSEDTIVDFFSGSGTTANAIINVNAQYDSKRKFIMMQLPEECEENSEAYKANFRNICDIGEERIRRAGEKVKENNPNVDIGFKVFYVDDTNIKWNLQSTTNNQINFETLDSTPDLRDFVLGSNDIDVVYEIVLRQKDIPISSTLVTLKDLGNRVYLFANSYLICLEEKVSGELIKKISEINPMPIKYVFRDSAFSDDIVLKDETIRRLNAFLDKNNGEHKIAYTVEFI